MSVGDHLAVMIPKQYRRPDCRRHREDIKRLNDWGAEGCKSRREEIVDLLCAKAESVPQLQQLPARTVRVNARWLLRLAIRNAERYSPGVACCD